MKVCFDPRHEKPCVQPCPGCREECDSKHLVETHPYLDQHSGSYIEAAIEPGGNGAEFFHVVHEGYALTTRLSNDDFHDRYEPA